MQQQFVVIDHRPCYEELIRLSRQFVASSPRILVETQHGSVWEAPTEHPVELTPHRANMIIIALINETMGAYLSYREPYDATDEIVKGLRNSDNITMQDRQLAELFITDERVDSEIAAFQSNLGYILAGNPWQEWHFYMQSNHFCLIGGQDYRFTAGEIALGIRDDDPGVFEVNVQALANYLYQQFYKDVGVLAQQFPVKKLIADGITRHYHRLSFGERYRFTYHDYQVMGISPDGYQTSYGPTIYETPDRYRIQMATVSPMGYDVFYNHYLRGVMDTFALTYLKARLDAQQSYSVEITDDFTLVFRQMDHPLNIEAQECHDIATALERGDWVPESDRRRLDQFQRYQPLDQF